MTGCKPGGPFVFVYIYLPHDYNNYKEMPKKKCRKKWRGGLKEAIELMLIRPPQLQFFEDGIKITATDTIRWKIKPCLKCSFKGKR